MALFGLERPVATLVLWLAACLTLFIPIELAAGEGIYEGVVAGIGVFVLSVAAGSLFGLIYKLSRVGVPPTRGDAGETSASAPVSLRDAAKVVAVITALIALFVAIGVAVKAITASRVAVAVVLGGGFGALVTIAEVRGRIRGDRSDLLAYSGILLLVAGATVSLADGPAEVSWPLFGVGLMMSLVSWRKHGTPG
jgi:hypothetical protein